MVADFIQYYSKKTSDLDDRWFFFTKIQFEWILTRLRDHYKTDDNFTVLDLGCGTGRLLSMIADIYPNARLTGVDGTPKMIHKTRERLKGRCALIQADLNDYIPTNRYDVIISTTVIHHLDDPHHHLDMIHNTLNNDGHAFISEFAINTLPLKMASLWWKYSQLGHKQSWSSRNFQKMIKQTNFKVNKKSILKPDNFWRLQIYDLA